jgi:hypothetical protein
MVEEQNYVGCSLVGISKCSIFYMETETTVFERRMREEGKQMASLDGRWMNDDN